LADATTAPAPATSTTAPAPVAPAPSTPAVVADASTPTTTPPSEATAPVSPEPVAAAAAPQEAAPTAPAEPPAALFTLPEDIKLAPEATQKFEAFLRPKLGADGKVSLTSQEVADQFIEQAKDANVRWMKQMEDLDKSNEKLCKQRFTPAQLSQAEAAVGFASSIDPGFREFAKRQLNDPVFVNFMREIGERLSEDEFERGSMPPSAPRRGPMTRAEAGKALYGKSMKSN
jgi:hypothetical protein